MFNVRKSHTFQVTNNAPQYKRGGGLCPSDFYMKLGSVQIVGKAKYVAGLSAIKTSQRIKDKSKHCSEREAHYCRGFCRKNAVEGKTIVVSFVIRKWGCTHEILSLKALKFNRISQILGYLEESWCTKLLPSVRRQNFFLIGTEFSGKSKRKNFLEICLQKAIFN